MVAYNNARIVCSEHYIAVCDIKQLGKHSVWVGTILPNIKSKKKMEDEFVYFLRDRESKYPEVCIEDKSVVGVKFWMIPLENTLFGYEPPSTILKPDIRLN